MYRLRLFVILIVLFHISKIWSQDFDSGASSSKASMEGLREDRDEVQAKAKAKTQPEGLPEGFTDADKLVSHGRSPWSANYFLLSSMPMAYQTEGRFSSYNFIGVDYRTSYTTKISLRPEFYWSGAGRDRFGDHEGKVEPGNIYLAYTDNEFGLIPSPFGDLGIRSQYRVYLPTSSYSQQQKQITHLEFRLQFYRPLGNGWQFNYRFHPGYYVQSQKAFLQKFDDGGSSTQPTPMAELEHYVEIDKAINRRWAISQDIGFKHQVSNSSPINNVGKKERTQFYFRPGINFYEAPVSFKLGISFIPLVKNGSELPGFYNPDDSEYSFLAYVGF